MPAPASQSRRWVFTLFNYTQDDEVALKTVPSTYMVYGKEIAPDTGSPHLQGFIIFEKPKRLSALKKIHPQAHWESAKADSQRAADYCKKGEQSHDEWNESNVNGEHYGLNADVTETGEMPGSSGKRKDLDDFKELVKSGVTDLKTLREECTAVCAKYPRFVNDYLRDQAPAPHIPDHPLRPWQQELVEDLAQDPEDRKVIFIVDEEGNKGKSYLAKKYCREHPDAKMMRPGKHADMAYLLELGTRVLFLDCTRTQVEYMPYTFLEELKDGYVQSTKYECTQKTFERMHVVVLMNQFPDLTKLSADRYDVRDLRDTPIWNNPEAPEPATTQISPTSEMEQYCLTGRHDSIPVAPKTKATKPFVSKPARPSKKAKIFD